MNLVNTANALMSPEFYEDYFKTIEWCEIIWTVKEIKKENTDTNNFLKVETVWNKKYIFYINLDGDFDNTDIVKVWDKIDYIVTEDWYVAVNKYWFNQTHTWTIELCKNSYSEIDLRNNKDKDFLNSNYIIFWTWIIFVLILVILLYKRFKK